jgi:cellulose synthase (UDP-forming)
VLTYFDGWQKAVFYVAPVIVLLTGTLPLITGTTEFLWHFVPYYLLTFWVFEEMGRGYGRSLFIEQYNMARFAAFAWATLAWVWPNPKFRVTRKGAKARGAMRLMAPQWTVMALNFAAIPVALALWWLGMSALPLDGMVANSIWALVNGGLALAVIAFTAATQAHTRSGYRFKLPLAAQFRTAGGAVMRGTVDDVSDTGLRFYADLAPGLAVGDPLHAQLELPDGPLQLQAEVRGLFCGSEDAGVARAIGCRFTTRGDDRLRLEAFLFGSDLQWSVNGYTDQVHTPLSRLFGKAVPGPVPHPLTGKRWNAAWLRRAESDAAASEPALLCAGEGERLLSYRPLPEGPAMEIQVFRRTRAARRRVRLQAAALPGGTGPGLHLYDLLPVDVAGDALAAPSSPAVRRGPRVEPKSEPADAV